MLDSIWRTHRAALAWAVLVAVLLLLPAPPIDDSAPDWLGMILGDLPWLDKLGHGLLFLILALLLSRSLGRRGVARTAVLAAGAAIAYGVALEFVQQAVPGRSPELLDAVADTLGAVVGAILGGTETTDDPTRRRKPRLDESR